MNKKTIIGVVLCLMLLLVGCVEKEQKDLEPEVEVVEDVNMSQLVFATLSAQGISVIDVKELTGEDGGSIAAATLMVADEITEDDLLSILGYTTGVLYEGFSVDRIATGITTTTAGDWCTFVIDSSTVKDYMDKKMNDTEFLNSYITECGGN